MAFNTVGAVSTNRIHELFGNVFEIPLSTGTVVKMVHNCAANIKPVMDRVRADIAGGAMAHFDETGCRVARHLNWVHVASTESVTFLYLSDKRGSKGMDEGGILPNFHGIAIHDCRAPYWKYDMGHGICCAHLLRELNGVKQPDGTIKSLTPWQVADLLGHSTSEITEMYYVKKDTARLNGITEGFEL